MEVRVFMKLKNHAKDLNWKRMNYRLLWKKLKELLNKRSLKLLELNLSWVKQDKKLIDVYMRKKKNSKIPEEIIVVTVSKLLKDSEQSTPIMGPDAVASLEAVIQELAGANALVELALDK